MLVPALGALFAWVMLVADGTWGVVPFIIGMFGLAAGVTVLSVVTRTHRQVHSPPELLARVMASVRFISWGAIPVGAVVAGAAADLWTPRAGLVVVCLAAVGIPLAIWRSVIRGLSALEDAEPGIGDAQGSRGSAGSM